MVPNPQKRFLTVMIVVLVVLFTGAASAQNRVDFSLRSIDVGIRALPETTRAVVIALVDHPAVPASIVSKLIEQWQQGDAKIVIPTWQDRGGHPVLIDLSFRRELENLAQPTSGGLRQLFNSHQRDVKRLPLDSPFVARDMDTWDDYLALYEEAFGYPPPTR